MPIQGGRAIFLSQFSDKKITPKLKEVESNGAKCFKEVMKKFF
jgi:hypothetical protein